MARSRTGCRRRSAATSTAPAATTRCSARARIPAIRTRARPGSRARPTRRACSPTRAAAGDATWASCARRPPRSGRVHQGGYCPEGSAAVTPCPAGSFGNATGLGSEQDCHACPAGSFCFAGASCARSAARDDCTNASSERCSACETGKFQGAKGATACTACDAGFSCPEGSAVQIPAACAPAPS